MLQKRKKANLVVKWKAGSRKSELYETVIGSYRQTAYHIAISASP